MKKSKVVARTQKSRSLNRVVSCYVVSQTTWNLATNKGTRADLIVLATSMREAAEVAGDDKIHVNENIQRIGAITLTPDDKYRAMPTAANARRELPTPNNPKE